MSLVGHQVSDRKVAANQSNAQKSTGPKTPEGKAFQPNDAGQAPLDPPKPVLSGEGIGSREGAPKKTGQNGQTNPPCDVESMT
jgi:hypothetical protein